MKAILLALLLVGCSQQAPPSNPNGVVVLQDIESCTLNKETPWCNNACKEAKYEWCN